MLLPIELSERTGHTQKRRYYILNLRLLCPDCQFLFMVHKYGFVLAGSDGQAVPSTFTLLISIITLSVASMSTPDNEDIEGPPPVVPFQGSGYFLGSHIGAPKSPWWTRYDRKWREARGLPPPSSSATLFFVHDDDDDGRSPSPAPRSNTKKRRRRADDDGDDDGDGPGDDDDDDGDFDPRNAAREPETVWTGRTTRSRRKRQRVAAAAEEPATEVIQFVQSSTAS